MKRKLFFLAVTFLGGIFVVSGNTLAEEYTIGGNGAGSNNSIDVKTKTSQETQQSNSAEIDNKSNSSANTGGNETDGGSIKTGDSSVVEKFFNKLNLNQSQSDCCPTGAPTSAPTQGGGPASTLTQKSTPSKTPTVTTDPGQPTNPPAATQPDGQGGIGGGPSDGDGGAGGGAGSSPEVLGLAAASGELPWGQVLQILGLVCTSLGIKKLNGELRRS